MKRNKRYQLVFIILVFVVLLLMFLSTFTGSSDDSKVKLPGNVPNNITVLTNFILYKNESRQNIFGIKSDVVRNKMINARTMEVVDVLSQNLNHNHIAEIHVLVEDQRTGDYLRRLGLKNASKLTISVIADTVTMKAQLEYAGNFLLDRVIAICHQDSLFGEGWQNLRPDILKQNKIMYALTRHTEEDSKCSSRSPSANCDPGYPYLGSHDVFLYHVKERFPEAALKLLDNVTPNLYGMENLLIWMFRQKLGYIVLNPCRILFVHHQHCVAIREKGRRRVDTALTKGVAPFTISLVPSGWKEVLQKAGMFLFILILFLYYFKFGFRK